MSIYNYLQRLYKNQTVKNFSALAIVQSTNYLFPLITLPYVLNIVSPEKFGVVALAQAFFTYQIITTDFSFNLTSSASLAQAKNDPHQVSKIFSETITIKLIILLLMFLLLQVLILTTPRFQEEQVLFNLGFFLVIGQAILPTWFFQGIEKMQFLTYINFISKTICVVLLFVLIDTKDDYIYILALNGFGNILSGCICLVLVFKKFNVRYILPRLVDLKTQLREGANLLYSSLLVNIYINSNILILSYFVNDYTLGLYSVAEKIILTIRSLLVVFYQATYPQVSKIKAEGARFLQNYYRKAFPPFMVFIFFIAVFSVLFSNEILHFLTGKSIPEMTFYLKLFSIVPIIVALNIPPNQSLLLFNGKNLYFLVILIGTILNIILNTLLSSYFSATGTITAIIITELFMTIGFYYSVYRKKIYS